MLARIDHIASDTLAALHRECLDDASVVRGILQRMCDEQVVLQAGVNRRSQTREARVIDVQVDIVRLKVLSGDFDLDRQAFFAGELSGVMYFFAATACQVLDGSTILISFPRAFYRAERRGEPREAVGGQWTTVMLPGSRRISAEVLDRSAGGASIEIGLSSSLEVPDRFRLSDPAGEILFARARGRRHSAETAGRVRIGVSLSVTPSGTQVAGDTREVILRSDHPAWNEIRQSGSNDRGNEVGVSRDPVYFYNSEGRFISGVVDRTLTEDSGAPVVVIPPAWGSTKESSIGMSLTILETFRQAGEAVSVLRYDGTNRRGESYLSPKNQAPGCEYLSFTFSGAARDLCGALSFARQLSTGPLIVASASLAAIEARHVVAGGSHDVTGWLSLLGVADLRSALRAISGGIDYGEGIRRGFRFGRHELLGVTVDMDATGLDALRERIAFEEDARREMASIDIPVTWIHGRYDGWLDLSHVRETLSAGEAVDRRLIEIPTGHRLGDGRTALATYVLAAEEILRLAIGRAVDGRCPTLARIRALRERELAHVREDSVDLRGFWRSYLVGRDEVGGMELLCGTASYRNFMSEQMSALSLPPGARFADLGAGLGACAAHLAASGGSVAVYLVELDYVQEALRRSRYREELQGVTNIVRSQVVFDLDQLMRQSLPFSENAFEAVIASLVIGYLEDPSKILAESRRILVPGGRLVLSALHRDADVSLLYSDGLIEFATNEAREALLGSDAGAFEKIVREFLNDGVKLMQLEERGRFRFWDRDELESLVSSSGFVVESVSTSLGHPPQALIASAVRA